MHSTKRATWTIAVVTVLAVAVYAAFAIGDRQVGLADRYGFHVSRAADMVAVLGFGAIGLAVALRRPANPIGWLWLAGAAANAVSLAARGYAVHTLFADPGSLPAGRWAAWLENWLWVPGFVLPVMFVLLLFPDGHLPGRRWRPVLWAAVAVSVGSWSGAALSSGRLEDFPTVRNPLGLAASDPLAVLTLLLPVVVVVAVAGLVTRYRHGDSERRQQIKWVAYAATTFAAGFAVATVLQPWNTPGVVVLVIGLPSLAFCAATAIAILRYRLYDIDVLINRTLVYAGLSAVVLGVSIGTVGVLTLVVGGLTRLPASLAAAVVAATLAHPTRERLQRLVNRLMYGDRDEPYAVIARLGRRASDALAPDSMLAAVVDTVAESLRFPYVAIEIPGGAGLAPAATHGTPSGECDTVPLIHQGLEVGRLVVSRRGGHEPLTPADNALLTDLAHHIAAAVRAAALASDLQRSREQLIVAREEERRRIRRDLHDGLGPSLAALGLSAGAARNVLRTDPTRAEQLLDELQRDSQSAVGEIRRLVYALRPPALDELGLVGAVREHAVRLGIDVDAPDELGPLSAAVEVAALRIAVEAMTNVSRHANAHHATVRLRLNGALELDVTDDGRGIPTAVSPGVGLRSMHERADELGGSCRIESKPGSGTRILVRLPVLGD